MKMAVLSKLPLVLSNEDVEDIDIRYENGCIYIVKHKTDESKECYIGSTRDFKQRCSHHKVRCYNENSEKYNLKVYKYIRENGGMEAWEIVKLYDYPCKNKYELELEERRAIEEYKSTLNTIIPTRSHAEYLQINKDILAEKKRLYNKNNKEKFAEKKRQYYQNNKEEIKEWFKQYYQNNKEKIINKEKQYYQNNREEIIAKRRQRYQNNKEEVLAKQRVKINCDNCNRLVSKGDLARHKRSNYCLNHK